MSINNRQLPRFPDFARACLNEVSDLPGFLEDVSKTGCKVRFAHSLTIDMEDEYTLTILPALRSGIEEFDLTVRPQWIKTSTDSSEIGFTVLHSPGIRLFTRYVERLAEQEAEDLQEA